VRIEEVDRWMAGGRHLRNAATIGVDVEGGCHAFGVKVASYLLSLSCTITEVAVPRTTSDKSVKAATGRQDSAQACYKPVRSDVARAVEHLEPTPKIVLALPAAACAGSSFAQVPCA